jgi:DNA-binding IclR family transcriptional regulator
VASVERALRILLAFRQGELALPLAEVARRTGMYKSTILRLASTLCRQGFLERLADGGFRLGHTLLHLGSLYRESFRLEDVVLPALQQLVRVTGESARFYVRQGSLRVCLFTVDSTEVLREHILPGRASPIDDTAAGQIFTLMSRGALPARRALPIYTQGIMDPLTASCAAPLVRPDGTFLGVVAISGPTGRFWPKRKAAGRRLMETVAALSRQVAGAPAPFSA